MEQIGELESKAALILDGLASAQQELAHLKQQRHNQEMASAAEVAAKTIPYEKVCNSLKELDGMTSALTPELVGPEANVLTDVFTKLQPLMGILHAAMRQPQVAAQAAKTMFCFIFLFSRNR